MPNHARIALLVVPLALAACERRTMVKHDPAPRDEEPTHLCALPDDGIVTTDVVLDRGCTLRPTTELVVREGASLRLRPGARLIMARGASIHVQGALSVKGTELAPATITTDVPKVVYAYYAFWGGISVEGEHARLELDHAAIDRGGLDSMSKPCEARLGAVRVVSPTAHVSIVASSIRMSRAQGVLVDVPLAFDAFEGNVIEADGDVALRMPASTLASVGEGNLVHGAKVVPTGSVETSMRWPSFDGSIAPESNLVITGTEAAPTTLTLARGTTLAMADQTAIVVQPHAGLVARGTRFTSARVGVSYGVLWMGIVLQGDVAPTTIEDAVVEFAGSIGTNPYVEGRSYDHHPAIETADLPTVHVARTTFRFVNGWAFESSAGDGCGSLAAPESGNVVVGGGALCREHYAPTPPTPASPLEAVKSYVLKMAEIERKVAALKN